MKITVDMGEPSWSIEFNNGKYHAHIHWYEVRNNSNFASELKSIHRHWPSLDTLDEAINWIRQQEKQ